MNWHFPCSSVVLSEARLYAIESADHTMNYKGWDDQHKKLLRITYGKFTQLWVYEFCKVNGVYCEKDISSPKHPDDKDLIICGHDIDVKASIIPSLLGQISPGMYKKQDGFFCFVLTTQDCTKVMPRGFLHCSLLKDHCIEVKQGEIIPGTNIKQKFESSRFLQPGAPVVPFLDFIKDAKNGEIHKHLPMPNAVGM